MVFVVDFVGMLFKEFYVLNFGFNCWVMLFEGFYRFVFLLDKVSNFVDVLVKIDCNDCLNWVCYIVKLGDSLSEIVSKYYIIVNVVK